MLAYNEVEVLRLVHHPKRVVVWLLRILRDFLAPLIKQLGILTEDSLANCRIKIIIHELPSYEEAETVNNKTSDHPPREDLRCLYGIRPSCA